MSGTAAVLIEHNFETAHRLPFLGGKCENLHGHSWRVEIAFVAYQHATGMDSRGISCEYGKLKQVVRTWIDSHLDHGCMLGVKDPLLPVLLKDDSKVFVFGDVGYLVVAAEEEDYAAILPSPERVYATMPWPTVEAVARMLAEELQTQVDRHFGDVLWVDRVVVTETAVNKAVWTPSGEEDDRRGRKLELVSGFSEEHSPTAAALRGEDIHP
jgi:6-pyruvoyltetrahydropterin/6-carboxytetrahydropterin synthase